jgi:hypothetical protein
MILFAEFKYGSNVAITTPTRVVFSTPAPGDTGAQNVIIKNETIVYSSKLFESGYEIREEPQLFYGIRSS